MVALTPRGLAHAAFAGDLLSFVLAGFFKVRDTGVEREKKVKEGERQK